MNSLTLIVENSLDHAFLIFKVGSDHRDVGNLGEALLLFLGPYRRKKIGVFDGPFFALGKE